MRGWIAVLGLVGSLAAQAQVAATKTVLPFPRYKQMQGKLDADGLPISGAKLCLLSSSDTCFTMPSHAVSENDMKYPFQFGLEPKSERLSLANGGSLIFFTGTFSGGGSGLLERLALLRFGYDGKITDLLPYITVTDQSDRAMWQLPAISSYPILVTADFLWDMDAGETHFAHHFYQVRAYHYDPKLDRYVEAFSYKTSRKYAGEDDADRIRVLAPERAEILRRLGVAVTP